ncbi:hypothetical protein [Neobacillus sp. LXY-4]|uniref:hypothetical protein n=1 Tax=Neobacillus sp. LXY-4 TaxID=3379826 RepID=UPI003EE12528
MKYYRYFVVISLVISVLMNYVLLNKIEGLENQGDSILEYQNQLMSNIQSQTSNIENVMNEIKQEQSWISTIESFVDRKGSQAEITFEWQMKELQNNSNIVFNYSLGEDKEYLTVPAVNKKNGLFYVTVPVDVEFEPHWVIQLNASGNQAEVSNDKEIEERKFDQNAMKYFVSASSDDIVKSSEIHKMDLTNLGSMDYGLLDVIVDMTNNDYFVSVLHSTEGNDNFIPLKKVYIMKYRNKELIKEEKLISDDSSDSSEEEPVFFRMKQSEKLEYTRLLVKVVYSNGQTFEKEINLKK